MLKFIIISILYFVSGKKDFTYAINKYRQTPVIRNFKLEKYISDFSTNSTWYYENGNYSYPTQLGKFSYRNGDSLMKMPHFYNYSNYKFLFRDRTNRSIKYILNFRARQKDCFDWNKCDTNNYDQYVTCLKNVPDLLPYKKCSWAWHYYPKFLEPSFKEIACVKVKNPPVKKSNIFVSEDKKFGFFCYGLINSTNDYPFD